MPVTLNVPELSLVVLIGASGSGKSTFARKHFKATEVLSSDFCRGLVSDDENSQAATKDAFELLHFLAAKRLAAGKLTVVDATNVQAEARQPLVALARAHHCLPVAIVLDLPERLCHERNATRPDRDFGPHVVRQQAIQLRRSLRGLQRVEEKHMGSRAVVIICRDEAAARKRFRVAGDDIGICYTRTGRRFFESPALEAELLGRVRAAAEVAGLWDELRTDWMCLDCELMPWSAKAQELLRRQYAAVGSAAGGALDEVVRMLGRAAERVPELAPLLGRYRERAEMAGCFVEAYRRYCWPVASINDLKLAPFHLLATEGGVHVNRDHGWHLEALGRLCRAGEALLLATASRVVDVTDPASQAAAVQWWEERTARGSEGMVVKPLDFIARGRRELVQPAVKCRGREYLRIIYGPEYTTPENLERLRARGLGFKRSLALREFALGIEALERFVRREPLYRVHECVFGILALESEPVDPRL